MIRFVEPETAMRRAAATIIAVLLALTLGGCGADGGSGSGSTATEPPALTQPPSATTQADVDFQLLVRALLADQTRTLLQSGQVPVGSQLIADDLRQVNPAWNVTGQDVENAVQGTCSEGDASWIQQLLRERLPGADRRVLPALDQVLQRVADECPVGDQDLLSTVWQQVLNTVTLNALLQRLSRPRIPPLVNQVCKVLNDYDNLVSKAAEVILDIASRHRIKTNAVDLTVNAATDVCIPLTNWVWDVVTELRSRGGG